MKCAQISDTHFKNVYFCNINFTSKNDPAAAFIPVPDFRPQKMLKYPPCSRFCFTLQPSVLKYVTARSCLILDFNKVLFHSNRQWRINFLWLTSVDAVQPCLFSRVNWFDSDLVVKVTVSWKKIVKNIFVCWLPLYIYFRSPLLFFKRCILPVTSPLLVAHPE